VWTGERRDGDEREKEREWRDEKGSAVGHTASISKPL